MKSKIATYRWSEWELNALRKLVKNKELTYYDLSELIGRTPKSIKWKLKLLRSSGEKI